MRDVPAQSVEAEAPSQGWGAVVLKSRPEPPPVIILNMAYSGLAIARDLARRNLRLLGLSAERHLCGNATRFCKVRLTPDSNEEPEKLAEYLRALVAEFGGAVIFPTRDADVNFLDKFRDELQPHYRLAIPPRDVLQRVVNKSLLAELAARAGIAVPRTLTVHAEDEIPRVAAGVGYPCVVKPVSSVHWRSRENWQKVGARKAFLVSSEAELRREYRDLAAVHAEILVQEWIPGTPRQLVILGGYVGADSELLGYFTARKIVQTPEDFGTGCVVQSEPIPEVVEPTRRLLRALNYRGMAEVEYKLDSQTGSLKLIEINTRHWDQHQLARASGVNLSWIAYRDLTGDAVEPAPAATAEVKWIAEDSLFVHWLDELYHGRFRVAQARKQVAGRRMYAIFSVDDPLPFFKHFFGFLLPGLFRQAVHKFRGRRGM